MRGVGAASRGVLEETELSREGDGTEALVRAGVCDEADRSPSGVSSPNEGAADVERVVDIASGDCLTRSIRSGLCALHPEAVLSGVSPVGAIGKSMYWNGEDPSSFSIPEGAAGGEAALRMLSTSE